VRVDTVLPVEIADPTWKYQVIPPVLLGVRPTE
jgi:hypothetical protein